MRGSILAILMLVTPMAASAAEPSTSSGGYEADGRKIAFSHVLALRQDDAEKMRESGPGYRVLLSDVALDVRAIEGGLFPPVRNLAQARKMRGVLLDFDPAKPQHMVVTVLDPAPGEAALATISLSDNAGLWKKLEATNGWLTAELKERPGMTIRFAAPILEDPPKEDLRGPAARSHPLVAMLRQQVTALGRGDLAAADAHSSVRQRGQTAGASPALITAMRQQAPMMLSDIGRINRIVVRGNIATALGPDGAAYGFVSEDDAWKID